jgi:hypothetical protein
MAAIVIRPGITVSLVPTDMAQADTRVTSQPIPY